jgi:hypothetical protein
MDNIEIFNNQLAQLINESKLPLSVLILSLQNNIFQMEILKLKQEIERLNKKEIIEINDDNIEAH